MGEGLRIGVTIIFSISGRSTQAKVVVQMYQDSLRKYQDN